MNGDQEQRILTGDGCDARSRPVRSVPWLFLFADFELLKLARGVDWSWVRAQNKPYEAKISWLIQQVAPFERVGSAVGSCTALSEWWDASQPGTRLECYFDFEQGATERHTIRSSSGEAGRRVKATYVLDLNVIAGSAPDVAATAYRHVTEALHAIARHQNMSPPPVLPLTKKER